MTAMQLFGPMRVIFMSGSDNKDKHPLFYAVQYFTYHERIIERHQTRRIETLHYLDHYCSSILYLKRDEGIQLHHFFESKLSFPGTFFIE